MSDEELEGTGHIERVVEFFNVQEFRDRPESSPFDQMERVYLIHRDQMIAHSSTDTEGSGADWLGWEIVEKDEFDNFVGEIDAHRQTLELAARTQIRDARVAELVASGLPPAAAEVLAGPPFELVGGMVLPKAPAPTKKR